MEDAGIHDIRSCNRVPGIYIASWYSVTSSKTEIGFSFVALQKRWWILSNSWIHFGRPYDYYKNHHII